MPGTSGTGTRAHAPYRAEQLTCIPCQSVQPHMLFPTSSAGQPQTKVDNTIPSEEREIPEGTLKYTLQKV